MEEESSNALDHGMSNTVTFLALTLIVLAVALLTVFITRQRNSRNRKRGEKLLADLQTNSANIAMIRFENSHFVQKIKCAALKDGPIDLFLETRFRGLKQKGRFVFHCIKRIGPGEYLFVVDTLIEDFVITGLGGSGIQGSVHPGTDPHSHLLQTAELAAEQARTSPSLGKQFFQVISSGNLDFKKFNYYTFILRINPEAGSLEIWSESFDNNDVKFVQQDFAILLQDLLKPDA